MKLARRYVICAVATVLGGVGLMPSEGSALPFNDDMVAVQKRTGVLMRQKVEGTVPLGTAHYDVQTREEAEKLENPLKGDSASTANGKRLFNVNCAPCHGDISKKPVALGVVGEMAIQKPPVLTDDAYKSRTDGNIYGTIHFGIRLMPGHGWKLSPTEHWDIINYVRSQQGIQ
jgi:mono/diheme cytochrome c family protein